MLLVSKKLFRSGSHKALFFGYASSSARKTPQNARNI
jgi:hypothetical protein